MQPSPATRQLEAQANNSFYAYREQYFGVGTSSAYLWDLENGFAGCFLIKKGFPKQRFRVSTAGAAQLC
jgi:capping protein beta